MKDEKKATTVLLYTLLAGGAAVFAWKGITLTPFFCIGVIGLRRLGFLLDSRPAGLRIAWALVLLYAAFSVAASAAILGAKGVALIFRGVFFAPEAAAAAAALAAAFLVSELVRRRFRWFLILDAAAFLLMVPAALEVAFQQMPFFAGGVSTDPAIVLDRRDRGFHFGAAFSPDGKTVYYDTREAEGHTLTACPVAADGHCLSTHSPGDMALYIKPANKGWGLFMSHDRRELKNAPVKIAFTVYRFTGGGAERAAVVKAESSVDFAVEPLDETLVFVTKASRAIRLDWKSGAVLNRCDIDLEPYHIVRNPESGNFYVSSLEGWVGELDRFSLCVKRVLKVGRGASGLALDPRSGLLYVSRVLPGSIAVIDIDKWRLVKTFRSFYFTRELAIAPQRGRLLAGDYRRGRVAVIDLESGKTIKILSFGKLLRQIAVSPDSARAAVVTYKGAFVFRIP